MGWNFNMGDFNTPFTPLERNDTLDQIDLIDINRTFHLKSAKYTFFSSTHGTSFRIDHILGNTSSICEFKKIEIISNIFSDHIIMRLEINYR